ncbi:MAG: AAA family ATPase [Streptococcus salivarius]
MSNILNDLSVIKQVQTDKLNSFFKNKNVVIKLKPEFIRLFEDSFSKITKDTITINEGVSILETSVSKYRIYFPTSWYYLAYLAAPYYNEITSYREYVLEIFRDFEKQNPQIIKAIKDMAISEDKRKYLKKDPFGILADFAIKEHRDTNIDRIIKAISQKIPENSIFVEKFLTDYEWWGGGKAIDRGDFFFSPILSLLRVINQSSSYIANLTQIITASEINLDQQELYFEFFQDTSDAEDIKEDIINQSELEPIPNCIYYGAPGTGKSHNVSELIKNYYPSFNKTVSEDSHFVFRTTLHPEYTYNDFVGQLMPVKKGENINYEFTPGVFSLALKKALINPQKYVFLVLEELSRANVASVFGDLFQLLDRKDGISEYSITNSLIANFVYAKDSDPLDKDYSNHKIFLPANLVIIGTVNTNDQNVFVMDTAFKRRFDWEYISTDPVGDNLNNPEFEYQTSHTIKWWDFYQKLNQFITSVMNLGEDKQIGQFFIHFKDDKEKNKKLIQNKLLQYLWEDVQKVSYASKLFSEEIKNFSDLYKKFGRGEKIFSKEFLELLEDKTLSQHVPETETLVEEEEEENNEAND